jgi:hypothetical protein
MTAPRKTPIPDRALPALVISVLFMAENGRPNKNENLVK